MAEVPVAIYDTQGIPISGEGVTFRDLGMSYSDMDSLGVWLAVRKGEDFVVGMRIDHVFDNRGLGRDNRYIILLKVPREKMEAFVNRFPELMDKILSDFEEAYNVTYKGKKGEAPPIDYEDVERITELIKLVPSYDEETLRKYGLSKDRVRIKLEGLEYDDPGIGDRAAALKFMFEVLRRAGSNTLTELMAFSKTSSASYSGIWIEKNAKTPSELLKALEKECEAIKKSLMECLDEKNKCLSQLEKCRGEREDYRRKYNEYSRLYREEHKSKGIGIPLVAGISVVLLLVGLFAGAYSVSLGLLPFIEKPGKIIPVSNGSFKALTADINNTRSKEVIEGYINFIKTAENKKIANLSQLYELVVNDSSIHEDYLSKISILEQKLEQENKTCEKEIKEYKERLENKTIDNLTKSIGVLQLKLQNFSNEMEDFRSETKCFSTLVGDTVMLTSAELQSLSKNPGVEGWEKVMTIHCREKLNETRENLLKQANSEENTLTSAGKALKASRGISTEILKNNVTQGDQNLVNNFSVFSGAIDQSLKTVSELNKSLKSYIGGLSTFNVSKVNSCSEACNISKGWNSNWLSLKGNVDKDLPNLPAVVVMKELRDLYVSNKTTLDPKVVKKLNVFNATKGLLLYIHYLPETTLIKGSFWKEVGELTKDLGDPKNPEEAVKYLERLQKLLYFINNGLG